MTEATQADIEMGQFALGLVMEDFRRRLDRKEMTEAEVAELVTSALKRFPSDFEPKVRDLVASYSADRQAAQVIAAWSDNDARSDRH